MPTIRAKDRLEAAQSVASLPGTSQPDLIQAGVLVLIDIATSLRILAGRHEEVR